MSKTITAVFKSRPAAAEAVDELINAGFSTDDVSVLMTDETRGREFGIEEHSKAPEGAAAGGAVGGTIGAIAAGLAATGVVAAPGIGLVAAGPIVASLAGAGAGAATGGVTGALAGLGFKEHEAKLYADTVEEGSILIGVEAHDDRAGRAEQILDNCGGQHVC